MEGIKVADKETAKIAASKAADKVVGSDQVWEAKKKSSQFTELKAEFKRIEWTPRSELKLYTKIILVSIFLFGMLVYLVDLAIQGGLAGLSNLLRWITG